MYKNNFKYNKNQNNNRITDNLFYLMFIYYLFKYLALNEITFTVLMIINGRKTISESIKFNSFKNRSAENFLMCLLPLNNTKSFSSSSLFGRYQKCIYVLHLMLYTFSHGKITYRLFSLIIGLGIECSWPWEHDPLYLHIYREIVLTPIFTIKALGNNVLE